MRNQNQINNQATEIAAVKAIAAASATPFKTAFKITMGIFVAQLVAGITLLASVIALGTVVAYFLSN